MHSRIVLVALGIVSVFIATASAMANPLIGRWKSDRDLTVARLEAGTDKVPAPRVKTILEEGDFGNAIVDYADKEYSWSLGDQTRRLPYKVLSIDGNHVEIQYFRSAAQTTPDRMRLFVSDDLMYVPIREFGFYEVFRRLPSPAAGDH